MVILNHETEFHKQIINFCVQALKQGKAVVYPTDTSYGLAVDATNLKAIGRLYQIKEREAGQPVHIIVPSIAYAKKIAKWDKMAEKLAKKFWPGPLTLVLRLKINDLRLNRLSAGTKFIGLRYPNNRIALDLAKHLKRPITTTSANVRSGGDNFDIKNIINQFKDKKHKPDIIINAGKLPKRKSSTFVKVNKDRVQVLREGPIKEKQIRAMTKMT